MMRADRGSTYRIGKLATGAALAIILTACGTALEIAVPGEPDRTAAIQANESSPSPAISWSGRGQEPFWTLRIDGRETEFRQPGAGYLKTASELKVKELPGGRTVATFVSNGAPYLVATRQDGLCIDGATGAPFPYSMEVRSGEQSFAGCGGSPDQYLAGTSWIVEDVNRKGVVDSAEPRFLFATDGSVTLNTICREIAGSYAVNGAELTFDFKPDPENACPIPALANQETAILTTVSGPLQMSAKVDGGLLLETGEGSRLLLRPHVETEQ